MGVLGRAGQHLIWLFGGGCLEKGWLSVVIISLLPAFRSLQLWVEERLPLAQSADFGTNLQTVQLFMKKNQVSLTSPASASAPAGSRGAQPRSDVQKAGDSRLLLLMAAGFSVPELHLK